MQSSIDVFQDVVRYLDSHEEALRIKKLIFCICKKYWENDPNILNSIPLDELLNELVQAKPSNEQLTFSVYKLVKTLNRPKVYAGVATIIIEQVSKLYNNISSAYDTQLFSVPVETEERAPRQEIKYSVDSSLEKASDHLANHPENSRIKKLLFATCKNRWENDTRAIDQYGVQNLILELQQNYPTITAFKQALNRIVENINKKALYTAIADIIILQFETLYARDSEYEAYESKPQEKAMKTQIIPAKDSPDIPRQERFQSPHGGDFGTSIIDFEDSPSITELHVAEPASPVSNSPLKEYDPFELRLEIFQYTNPLRVKILLYSILFHPWEETGQDWVTLRHYTLEEMLEQLIQSGKSLKEIEARLQEAARTQLDGESNAQTTSTLIQALQRIF
ncbi:hypothetical protein V0288_05960 [Pannus brasiliensis CCIBt3594]|uniref:Uncharacterized protein n=1 Tax=Pannus brasiliensis CCIBt3594 TaxID=1427578 RepID=A0AAW9QUT2_9CHRO